MATNPPPGPLSDYRYDAKKKGWVSISSEPTAKRSGGNGKKPKNVGYLADKYPSDTAAKLKGKSWYTRHHIKQNAKARQDKARQSYGSNRQVGLFAEKERAAKSGRTPTVGASKGGAGSSRPTPSSALGRITKTKTGEPSQWARAAFAKIVKEHPQGIDFKALRRWDNEDKAYNANPNLRRGRNATPEKNREQGLKLKPGIDFAALRRADKNWNGGKAKRSGAQ